jgi:pyrroloquinoline quinone biosynthesis protein B
MYVEILGSAAGGGFPQWNCNCGNCRSVRERKFLGKARTQTQVAVSDDGHAWFLLNASPDLRMQIEQSAALQPNGSTRSSPINAVVLTSADIDQIAGLLSLRELQRFRIYSTPSLGRILREANSIFGMLNRAPQQVCWMDMTLGPEFALLRISGEDSGLRCKAISVGDKYPVYVSQRCVSSLRGSEAQVGLVITGASGKRLAYLPAVSAISAELIELLQGVDVVLFDGTFWSDDELLQVQGSGATAREIGHVPVFGPQGSLELLKHLKRRRKVFLHINNTNPMLNESGPEYRELTASGWQLAEDGWRLNL